MSKAPRPVRTDESATLPAPHEPRPSTDETVVVELDRRLLRGARSALGYLEDAERIGDDASTVDGVRARADSLTARLDSQPQDRVSAHFDASDVVLLVSGLLSVGRYYADDGQARAADFHRQCAEQFLDALVKQRPELVQNLRSIAAR